MYESSGESRPKVNTELIYKALLRDCRYKLKSTVDQIILNRTPSIDKLNEVLSEIAKKNLIGFGAY